MRTRQLALVHYTAAPVTGGVESVMATHAGLLREAGHDVRVIAGRGHAELVPEVDSRHPDVERLTGLLATGDPAVELFQSLRIRLNTKLGPMLADRDLVIAHNILTMPFNLPLAAALCELSRPVVAWTHDLAWINPRYRAFRRPQWPWCMLAQPQPGACYVAISRTRQAEIARLMRLPRREVAVVPNGIDPPAFLGLSRYTLALSRKTGLTEADPLLLVPVRITRRKRLELAVEAAGILREEYPQLRLVVSGPLGPHDQGNLEYFDELRQQRSDLELDETVIFLCEFPRPDGGHPVDGRTVAQLYRMADLVLLTSESEGFGLPVLEASLSRAPFVTADIPVLREVAPGNDWTFPAGGDARTIAATVSRALGARPARLRRHAMAEYSWPSVMDRMERVIEAGCA